MNEILLSFVARWQARTLIDKLYSDCDYAGQSTDDGTSLQVAK